MAAITAPGEGASTRDLIERIAGGELGARLRGEVAGWHPDVARLEVEDAFQQACLLAASRCHGTVEWEVYKWLRTTTHRELNRVQRRARFEVLAEPRAVERHAGSGSAVESEVVDREDRAELEEAARTVLERLSDRQRAIAVLYARGNRRAQIASYLGITPRTVKRQLERIMAVGRDELVRIAGPGCEAGEALVARFAFGLASPRDVWRYKFLTATQILELWWPGGAEWPGQRRLLQLFRAGHLERFRPRADRGSYPWTYHLGPEGHRLLQEAGHIDQQQRYRPRAIYDYGHVLHELQLNAWILALRRAASDTQLTWDGECDLTPPSRSSGGQVVLHGDWSVEGLGERQPRLVRPDAVLTIPGFFGVFLAGRRFCRSVRKTWSVPVPQVVRRS